MHPITQAKTKSAVLLCCSSTTVKGRLRCQHAWPGRACQQTVNNTEIKDMQTIDAHDRHTVLWGFFACNARTHGVAGVLCLRHSHHCHSSTHPRLRGAPSRCCQQHLRLTPNHSPDTLLTQCKNPPTAKQTAAQYKLSPAPHAQYTTQLLPKTALSRLHPHTPNATTRT